MKEWLRVGAIPTDDETLASQLTGREFQHDLKQRIVLERKQDMKERGLESPDRADALAVTFATPVARRNIAAIGSDEDPILYTLGNGTYYSKMRPNTRRANDQCLIDGDRHPLTRLGD